MNRIMTFNTLSYQAYIKRLMPQQRVFGSVLFKGINILGQFLIIPLLFNKSDIQEFGMFVTISTVSIFMLSIDFGIVNAVKNPLQEALLRKDHLEIKTILNTSFLFILFLSIILFAFGFIIYITQFDFIFTENKQYLLYRGSIYTSAGYFLIRFTLQLVHAYNHSKNKYFINDGLLMIGTVVSLIGLKYISQYGNINLIQMVNWYFLPTGLTYILYWLYICRIDELFVINIKFYNHTYLKSLLKSSSIFFFLQLTWIALTSFIPIVLVNQSGLVVAGNYNVVSRLFNFLYVVNFIVLNNYWSNIFSLYVRQEWNLLSEKFIKILLISMSFAATCIIIAVLYQDIINLWIGNEINVPAELVILTCIYYIGIIVLSCMNIFMNSINYFSIQIKLCCINIFLLPVCYIFIFKVLGLSTLQSVFIIPYIIILTNIVITVLVIKRRIFSKHSFSKSTKDALEV